MRLPSLLAVAAFLVSSPAFADILVDDFEDVSDWSGLQAETSEVHSGTRAGRWDDHVTRSTARKAFSPALDASAQHHLQVWLYSAKANGALIELILDSENAADTAGSDYYRYQIQVDWTGWRYLRIPLDSFRISRNPVGWHEINSVAFHASGWDHEPMDDTVLVLDDMSFGTGVIEDIRVQRGFQGSDYVYDFTVLLEERTGSNRSLAFSLSPVANNPFDLTVLDPTVSLPANGTGQARVRITVPSSQISDATVLDLHRAALFVTDQGSTCDGADLEAAVPLPAREHPRTLLTAEDFTRIANTAQSEAWATSARDSILNSANGWPSSFEQEYALPGWQLPPEGGQWGLWYVCPTHGVRLRNEGPTTHVCPVDDQVFSGWPYDQVVYSWMHGDLADAARDLGLSYRMTGNAAHAQSALDILLAYADAYASYTYHDINGTASSSGGRVLSQTLDESVWLIPIAWAYDLIADAPMVTDDHRGRIERDLLLPAVATILRNPAGMSNWQSWHNAGIGAVGFALEDPVLIASVLRGADGFEYQMQESVTADGFWYEGAWGYHFYALNALMQLSEMASRAGYDAYGNPSLRGMFEAPLYFAMPDWTLPAFNDSGTASLVSNDRFFEIAYKRYQDEVFTAVLGKRNRGRDALLFGEASLPSSATLSLSSRLFPDSGYAVMRSGEGDDATYLALDYGPHGGWHGHYDKLGFVLFARGTIMGVDPGTQSYAAPTHDTWDKVTVAHSTVVVDETTQEEATGLLHRFEPLPAVTLASADAGEAYPTATLLRTMLMTPEYVVDRFRARSTDGAAHDFDWVHHNTGTPQTDLPLASYGEFPSSAGYQHLTKESATATSEDWDVTFRHAAEATEYGSTWANDGAITASFTHSQEQAHDGVWSGKLAYDFSQATGYVLYTTDRPDPRTDVPSGLRMALYGDGSGHELSVRVYDDTQERFVSEAGVIDWTGWKVLDVPNIAGWSHYLGDDDGVFDAPVRSVAVQVSHAAGGPGAGAIYVDDIELVYGPEAVLVEDFEIPARSLEVRMLGQADTTVVAGEGLGPDLLVPVPFVMARRRAVETVFESVFAPFGQDPRVTAFAALTTDAPAADEAGAYRIGGVGFDDRVLFVADGSGGTVRSFGDDACDGTVCLIRTDGQALLRLAIVGGKQLDEGGVARVKAEVSLDGLQVDYEDAGASLDLFARISIETVVRVWGPDVATVRVNEVETDFTRDGEYVVLNLAPTPDPDGGTGGTGGTGGSGGSGGTGGGAKASGGGDDDGGCGCRMAPVGGAGWWGAALLGLLGMARARRSRERCA